MSVPAGAGTPVHDADEILIGFTRALRAAGVRVTQDRAHGYLTAVSLVGLGDARATYEAGRATLCASPDDLARYDEVHEAYFNAREGLPRERRGRTTTSAFTELPMSHGEGAGDEADSDDVVRAKASDADILRERDVAGLSAAEKQRINALLAGLRPRLPVRRVARHDPWRRGRVDASRTLRASLRRMGEPATVEWRRRARRPRRVLLLVDVSGSMSAYAEVLLRLAHRLTQAAAARGGRVETFAHGHPAHASHTLPAGPRRRTCSRRSGSSGPGLVRRHPARRDHADLHGPVRSAGGGTWRGGGGLQRRLGAR